MNAPTKVDSAFCDDWSATIRRNARGVAVLIEGEHHCMSTRGVHRPGVSMVTTRLTGAFQETPALRAEFMALAQPDRRSR